MTIARNASRTIYRKVETRIDTIWRTRKRRPNGPRNELRKYVERELVGRNVFVPYPFRVYRLYNGPSLSISFPDAHKSHDKRRSVVTDSDYVLLDRHKPNFASAKQTPPSVREWIMGFRKCPSPRSSGRIHHDAYRCTRSFDFRFLAYSPNIVIIKMSSPPYRAHSVYGVRS